MAKQNRQPAMAFPKPTSIPMTNVRFSNIESPGTSCAFSYGPIGGKGGDIGNYHLFDGREYELPQEVVDHVNSLSTPIEKDEMSADGVLKMVEIGRRHRFSCVTIAKRELSKAA